MLEKYDYDLITIDSGFGGTVTALRSDEEGYRVSVLESGRLRNMRRAGLRFCDRLPTAVTQTCRCHGSRFDTTTGAVLSGLAAEPLNVHDVEEVAGAGEVRA